MTTEATAQTVSTISTVDPVGTCPADPKLFADLFAQMEPLLLRLWNANAAPRKDHGPVAEVAGVYLFTEPGKPMYVGQAQDLRQRLRQHTIPSSRQNQASFAFLLACDSTEHLDLPSGTREELEANPIFNKAFVAAKVRVAAMDVRFIELADPLLRTVLEFYAAVCLRTPYNDFETH